MRAGIFVMALTLSLGAALLGQPAAAVMFLSTAVVALAIGADLPKA